MPYVVVASEHRKPKFYVARKKIGEGFAIMAVATSEIHANDIAKALNLAEHPTAQVIKMKRKRA